MGKVTIIVENPKVSTRNLEAWAHKAMQMALERTLGPTKEAEVFVVPSDEEPYDGPDYPPGTNAGLP